MPDPYLAALSPALRTAACAIGTQALGMATALIRQCEGCRLVVYQDSKGVWTQGIGSLTDIHGNPLTARSPVITYAEAEMMFERVLGLIAPKLTAMVHVPMQPHEAAALLSFQYNEGSGALAGSTLLRMFNAGSTAIAAEQFPRWAYVEVRGAMEKVQGLVNRRALEQAVFLGKVDPGGTVPKPAVPTADDLNAAEINSFDA